MGRPSAVKGLAILAALSFPVPVARRIFCEAPGHARGIGLPVVRARGAHCKTALRPACAKHWLSSGLAACPAGACGRPSHFPAALLAGGAVDLKVANPVPYFFLLFCKRTCHKRTKIWYNFGN